MTISKNFISVEIHRASNGLFVNENAAVGQKLDRFFSDALEKRQMVDGLPLLSDKHQAAVLLLHKLEHFLSERLGLRQLCDWAMFVDKRLTEALWSQLRPQLAEFGLLTFTEVITRVCIDDLHLPQEKAPWAMEADQELVSEVMEQILASGNFGAKDHDYGLGYFTDVNSSNRLMSFIKKAFANSRYHWPVCEKYPILGPIAPVVAFGKYLKLRREGCAQADPSVSEGWRATEVVQGTEAICGLNCQVKRNSVLKKTSKGDFQPRYLRGRRRLSPILCKPPAWCKIEASHRRFYI